MTTKAMEAAELAKVFHETYERLAPTFGYATRIESAKPWEQVPPTNKDLMVAVCQEIISKHFPEPSVSVSELETLRKQRNAALKLADLWEGQAIKYPLENATSLVSPYTAEAVAVGQAAVRACANELRAIFEPKEGK